MPNNGTPPGSTYDAFIDAAGTYTLTLNTSETISDLILNGAGATLSISSGGTLNVVGNATLTAGIIQMTGGTLSGGSYSSTGGVIRFDGSGINTLSNVTLGSAGVIDLSVSGSFLRLEGTTALPAGGYTLGTSSTLVFNQAATLTGVALTLGNGASVFADGGNTVTLPASGSVTVGVANNTVTLGVNRLAANAGTVLLNQGTIGFAAGATNSTLNVSTVQGNGAFQNGGTVQANLSGDNVSITVPTFTNSGTLSASGGGTVFVSNTSTNLTNFSAGTLTGGAYVVQNGSTIDFNGRAITTIGLGTIVTVSGAMSTFAAANTVTTNHGSLTVGGGRSFTVSGAGALLTDGTLTVGSAAGDGSTLTGNVTNNSGGVIQGHGTVAGTFLITNGSIVSPGSTPPGSTPPGTLTVGNTTFQPGGIYAWKLNSVVSSATTQSLLASSSGTLDLRGLAAGNPFVVRPTSLKSDNTPGNVADFDGNQTYTLTIATFNGGILTNAPGPNSNLFTVDASNFTNPVPATSFFQTMVMGNSVVLQFQPVPEPATVLLVCAGGALLASVVPSRKKK